MLRPLLDHRAHETRWLHIHEQGCADDGAVDRQLARVIRNEQHTPFGNVLGSEDLGAKILSVERCDGRECVTRPIGIETERVDPSAAELHRHAREPRLELFVHQRAHPVVDTSIEGTADAIAHGREKSPKGAERAAAARNDGGRGGEPVHSKAGERAR